MKLKGLTDYTSTEDTYVWDSSIGVKNPRGTDSACVSLFLKFFLQFDLLILRFNHLSSCVYAIY